MLCGEDFEKIRTLFPISDIPAKPIDLFEREIPAVLYYGSCDYGKHTEFSLTLAARDSQIIYVAEDKSAFAKIGKSIMPEA